LGETSRTATEGITMGSSHHRTGEVLRLAYAQRRLIESIGRRAGVYEADLPDLVQRTVLTLLSKHARIEQGCERGFLAQVARREARHLWRTYQRRAEEPGETFAEVRDGFQQDDWVDQRRLLSRIDVAIRAVPSSSRDVWLSHVLAGESCQQVATSTGLPLGTIKSRLRRVTESLQRAISDLSDGEATRDECS
jgi:RNA polymerase sigma factor (sigma-70 family)